MPDDLLGENIVSGGCIARNGYVQLKSCFVVHLCCELTSADSQFFIYIFEGEQARGWLTLVAASGGVFKGFLEHVLRSMPTKVFNVVFSSASRTLWNVHTYCFGFMPGFV